MCAVNMVRDGVVEKRGGADAVRDMFKYKGLI
jgi:hypothetical protein